jgi:hypothetical protein
MDRSFTPRISPSLRTHTILRREHHLLVGEPGASGGTLLPSPFMLSPPEQALGFFRSCYPSPLPEPQATQRQPSPTLVCHRGVPCARQHYHHDHWQAHRLPQQFLLVILQYSFISLSTFKPAWSSMPSSSRCLAKVCDTHHNLQSERNLAISLPTPFADLHTTHRTAKSPRMAL